MYMATLTTTGGAVITFTPSGIAAIADHNDTTGQAVTTVYGIGNSPLMIAETVQAFLTRLNIAQAFAQLTRPDGRPVWISGTAVSMLRAPSAGEYAPAVKTVISAGPLTQGVQETPDNVTTALNAHGADL
jgi:hypothetical protein